MLLTILKIYFIIGICVIIPVTAFLFVKEENTPLCGTCKHKNKMVDEAPCDKCIDKTDLALRKPANETEFSNYERDDTK